MEGGCAAGPRVCMRILVRSNGWVMDAAMEAAMPACPKNFNPKWIIGHDQALIYHQPLDIAVLKGFGARKGAELLFGQLAGLLSLQFLSLVSLGEESE
ncbi:hypothetical protein M404DRAFT_1002481, partial [Pisolithus tinctorius Marx 270]